jgi:membrane-associated phospholipid phosphatase
MKTKPLLRILLIVAAWTAASIAALYADDSIRNWFRAPGHNDKPRTAILRPLLENAVEAQLYVIVPGILLSFANRRRLLIGYLTAMLLSVVFTHSLKFAVGRHRPHLDAVPTTVAPMTSDSKQQSFPSGHTSAAVAMAILLGIYFPNGKVFFWLLAIGLGLERVRVEAHFLSDVIAGAGIGVLSVAVARRILPAECFSARLDYAPTAAGSTGSAAK